MVPKVNALGIEITTASPDEIVDQVRGWIGRRQRGNSICAINVHTYTEGLRSTRYRQALNAAAIAFVDGVPIRWLLRAMGHRSPTRLHGADLMALLVGRVPEARHFFFGSTDQTLQLLQSALRNRFPGIRIAGAFSPPFRRAATREDPETLDRINQSAADIVWVGLGAPKQELWLDLNARWLAVPVCAGVGAAFDILAGRFRRAPGLLQRAGLEWAWRLAQDPGRLWRRYVSTNAYFLSLLLRESAARFLRSSRTDPFGPSRG